MFFLYLVSGLFLGWSLGANDAANVYGTAVGTRMIRFRSAAITCSIFVLLGAVFGGAGASHTLGKLGAVNALPGSFTVALAAALTVTWMTRLKLPVSTSQAVVGAIIGWNLYTGSRTDLHSLSRIVASWMLCPILAATCAVVLLKLAEATLRVSRIHLFRLDWATRVGLFVVGAFASYSLGANNIANVMGVFVPASPLEDLHVMDLLTLSGAQQLFLLGALAIGVGVFTYSRKVMLTVGNDLFRLSPISALIVVLSQAIVLFLFASESLEGWLANHGLPTIPLVPVSSSQAVIGAVIGIGLAKGGRNIRFHVLGRIASGWVSTPVLAGVFSFVSLFFAQNVFSQQVFRPVHYHLSQEVMLRLEKEHLYDEALDAVLNQEFADSRTFRAAIRRLDPRVRGLEEITALSELRPLRVDIERLAPYWDHSWYSEEQLHAVFRLHGRTFDYTWQLEDALRRLAPSWRHRRKVTRNKKYNKELDAKLAHLYTAFRVEAAE